MTKHVLEEDWNKGHHLHGSDVHLQLSFPIKRRTMKYVHMQTCTYAHTNYLHAHANLHTCLSVPVCQIHSQALVILVTILEDTQLMYHAVELIPNPHGWEANFLSTQVNLHNIGG